MAVVGIGAAIVPGDQTGDDGGGFRWRLHIVPLASGPAGLGEIDLAHAPRAVLYDVTVDDFLAPRRRDARRRPAEPADRPDRSRDTVTPIGTRMARQAGFTLLEILVALVVLGILLVGLSQATRFGILWPPIVRAARSRQRG